jgi:hypothetical protein
MPKSVNTTKKAAAAKKNGSAITTAMAAGGGLFGRVEKSLGDCNFKIIISRNGRVTEEVQGIVRGVMRGGRNSDGFIQPGCFVLLTESSSKLHEIAGVVNRNADMKALKKEGLIPKVLTEMAGEDDLFEEAEDVGEDEVDVGGL